MSASDDEQKPDLKLDVNKKITLTVFHGDNSKRFRTSCFSTRAHASGSSLVKMVVVTMVIGIMRH